MVPVWREVLADLHTPVAALLKLERSMPDAFLLESVEGGERWGRYSFLGGDSFARITAKDGRVTVRGRPPVTPHDDEAPLAYVRRVLETCNAPSLPGLPPLHGGAVGYIGYDCVRELERLGEPPPDDLRLPDLALLLTRTFVVFDHLAQRAFVITNATAEDGYDDAMAQCEEVIDKIAAPLEMPIGDIDLAHDARFAATVDDATFAGWVDVARDHIYKGDIFQVVVSRRFETPLGGSMLDAYRALRLLNPSPYMYYLRFGEAVEGSDLEIAGSSPEPLVRVVGDVITSRPIAGTRTRGRTETEDEARAAELLADAKERAEHVMLVDLARNDVGRVSRWGSVEVDDLMSVERYSHVMHIVSNVTGRLREGVTAVDALAACFPAGTVSGAPKVRAMEIIDELEVTRRGPYAGVVGYFDFSGNLDTCITIRTLIAVDGRAFVQAGAGIVADSVPQAEAEETRHKAEAVLIAAAASRPLRQSGDDSSD